MAHTLELKELPRRLMIRCVRDGQPMRGCWVSVRLGMRHKNPHVLLFGPSDDDGQLSVLCDELIAQAEEEIRLAPMDFLHLDEFDGNIAVTPLDAKRIRVLAVASPERWPNLPNSQTTAEAGFPSVEVLYWIGVSGPANLPPHIVKVWDDTMRELAKSKAYADGLLKVGLLPLYKDAKGMAAQVQREATETQSVFAR